MTSVAKCSREWFDKKKKKRNNEPDKRYPPIANLLLSRSLKYYSMFCPFFICRWWDFLLWFRSNFRTKMSNVLRGTRAADGTSWMFIGRPPFKVTISKNCQCFVVYFSLWFKALLCERDYVKLTFLVWRRYRG